ncbi:MAG: dockerin type I domain-containing protein [Planctomycetota bacterium]|nr:dockerin type I domain-containing protein [Planctomycetota bacterium]
MPKQASCHRTPGDRTRLLGFETLEARRLLTVPHGAMPQDLAEYLLGSTVVTPVFFESDGSLDDSTEDWTPSLIEETKAKIQNALDWWSDTFQRYQVCDSLELSGSACQALSNSEIDSLANEHARHEIDFVVNWTHADNPFSTAFEPINRISDDYIYWGTQFLQEVGYSGSTLGFGEDLVDFNHQQRLAAGTDWAFTLFVANSEQDAEDTWAEGGSFTRAFAFPQEKLIVLPSGRPASTTAHEIGHMYWAFDEYAPAGTYFSSRGYYNQRNENAHDNPTPGFVQVDSIMDREAGVSGTLLENAYASETSSPSSLIMVGWRDSDNDGIMDVLDVPHEITGTGYYDQAAERYEFHGTSKVQTLPNLNPRPSGARSGSLQNDITLNQITGLEYRIDGEDNPWQTGALGAPGATVALDLSIPVPNDFTSIEIRTVDENTGVQSAHFLGSSAQPTQYTASGISGFVRYDAAANGLDAGDVNGLEGWAVELLDAEGGPLTLRQSVDPDDYEELVELNEVNPHVTLTSIGDGVARTAVYARTRSPASTGSRVFAHALDATAISAEWTQQDRRLQMDFADPIATLSLDAVANSDGDLGRLEVYDLNDQLLARYTTENLDTGDVETMTLSRAAGDIAYAIASAHAGTAIRFDNLQFGAPTEQLTNTSGDFSFPHLPAGDYTLAISAQEGYELTTDGSWSIELTDRLDNLTNFDFGARLIAGANWQNPVDPLDVDNDGVIAPIDALLIVSHLNQFGSHPLPVPPQPPELPPPFLDVDGDDHVAPVDALLVIGHLNSQEASADGEANRSVVAPPLHIATAETQPSPPLPPLAIWQTATLNSSRKHHPTPLPNISGVTASGLSGDTGSASLKRSQGVLNNGSCSPQANHARPIDILFTSGFTASKLESLLDPTLTSTPDIESTLTAIVPSINAARQRRDL